MSTLVYFDVKCNTIALIKAATRSRRLSDAMPLYLIVMRWQMVGIRTHFVGEY
jgi:hypothetical protein